MESTITTTFDMDSKGKIKLKLTDIKNGDFLETVVNQNNIPAFAAALENILGGLRNGGFDLDTVNSSTGRSN